MADFWSKVDKSAGKDGCWLWTGTTYAGYGVFHGGGKNTRAHRYAYEELVGPIPEGLVCDHLCRVTNCVNPAHIDIVTNAVNTLRGVGPTAVNATKDMCVNGHALSGDNLYPRRNWRICKICQRMQNAKGKQKVKDALALLDELCSWAVGQFGQMPPADLAPNWNRVVDRGARAQNNLNPKETDHGK